MLAAGVATRGVVLTIVLTVAVVVHTNYILKTFLLKGKAYVTLDSFACPPKVLEDGSEAPSGDILCIKRAASFALHPLLMVVAFGLFAPLGAISHRVLRDLLGFTLATTKRTHMLLMTLAVLIGWLGIWDMWLTHANGASAQLAKGWSVHFQSAHSWIGIVVMVIFTWQWLGGIVVMDTFGFVSPMQMASSKGTHALMGAAAFYGALIAILLGILSLAGRGDNHAAKDVHFKMLSLEVLALGAALTLVFGKPRGSKLEAVAPKDESVTTSLTIGQMTLSVESGKTLDINVGGASMPQPQAAASAAATTAAAPPALPSFLVGDAGSSSTPSALPTYSWEEIGKHTTADDCWVVLFGHVYDVCAFGRTPLSRTPAPHTNAAHRSTPTIHIHALP